ncbi:HlyD family secretion protein [Chlorogloeopsis fritschii PCC 9212]|uniref:Multidrug resistance protein A n=1 Tax=Chlorogloeopsis fritschii PCC 6912 TaxID=211165 RepID=A0A3S0Y5Y8_CHLFR|nr:HlyD family secretion protein [Chlorogloeopsis fritschii]RUR86122.1 multidrug resistance protein A [Chlorogloeopsis fritschii PCC 6912]
MERLNSSQNTQQVAGLEEQNTPVLEQEVMSAITPSDSGRDSTKKVSPFSKRLLPVVVLGVLLGAGAIASGIYAYRRWQYTQINLQTNNAYVTADIHPVTSRISGVVTKVAVSDNQAVSRGMVLVELDPRDYQISLAQAKASLELAKQQANLAQTKIKNAANSPLVLQLSEPRPQNPANKNTQTNKNNLSQLQAFTQQRELNEQQYKTAQAAIAQKQADLKKAELELSYTKITALVDGKIGNRNVQVGQRIEPGQTLFTIVQPNPWIIANFQETQLEKIQPGQNVDIKIPAFHSRTFQGKVDSMYPTSSMFAFPPEDIPPDERPPVNAIRNSDMQQIPVKIVFDPNSIQGYESRITPGMSAMVTVKTK